MCLNAAALPEAKLRQYYKLQKNYSPWVYQKLTEIDNKENNLQTTFIKSQDI